jgi:hypothetical protein
MHSNELTTPSTTSLLELLVLEYVLFSYSTAEAGFESWVKDSRLFSEKAME